MLGIYAFQSEVIGINLRHCRHLKRLPRHDKTVIKIPVKNINWIRTAISHSISSGEFDTNYIEIQFREDDWKEVLGLVQKEIKQMQGNEQDLVFELRNEKILRIRTDFLYWPKSITEVWDDYKYPTSKDFNIPISEGLKAIGNIFSKPN